MWCQRLTMRVPLVTFLSATTVLACGGGDDPPADASASDAALGDGAPGDAASVDAASVDAASVDAMPALTYNCGAFTEAPTWTLSPGFHAVVVADEADGLSQPVAVIVAGGAFEGRVFVVNQGNATLTSTDPLTGQTSVLVAADAWSVAPSLLTTIAHDALGEWDGALYVGDQGGDGDADSRIYRVDASGAVTTFTAAPGPGLDDIYGLAFVPAGAGTPAGLHVTGDTDGVGVDWGVYDQDGVGAAFSEVSGCEGIAFDHLGAYGGGLLASCPMGGGYAGNDALNRLTSDGQLGVAVASAMPGVHGVALAPAGPFGGLAHVASWSSGTLRSITPGGVIADLASGLSLTNYDGNVLAFSPDGRVLFVVDRLANRLVCIEPITP